jgi:hypothetical protein
MAATSPAMTGRVIHLYGMWSCGSNVCSPTRQAMPQNVHHTAVAMIAAVELSLTKLREIRVRIRRSDPGCRFASSGLRPLSVTAASAFTEQAAVSMSGNG